MGSSCYKWLKYFFLILFFLVVLNIPSAFAQTEKTQAGSTNTKPSATNSVSTSTSTSTSTSNSSSSGNIHFYSSFENDLSQFVKRTDIQVYSVDSTKKQQVINNMKSFAKNFGIDVSDTQADKNGRVYKKVLGSDGEIDRYFSHTPADDQEGIGSEVVAVRKTWSKQGGSSKIMSDEVARSMADKSRNTYSLLIGKGEVVKYAATRQVRQVQGDEGETTVLRQIVGYYRMLGERQVINSTFLVYLDNATSTVAGMVIKSWWPSSTPQKSSGKSVDQLKEDITQQIMDETGSEPYVSVDSCRATYYQTSQNLVPSVTCVYRITENETTVDAGIINVSQVSQYSLKLSD